MDVIRTSTTVVTLLVLVVSIGITSAQVPSSANSGNLIAGQTLYFEHACYSCHGYTGETGQMPLLGSAFLLSEELFLVYLRLRADQNPLLPSTRMPNYSEESLSDEQAKNIYAYIRSFQSTTPELEDIPTLNAIIEAASRPYEP